METGSLMGTLSHLIQLFILELTVINLCNLISVVSENASFLEMVLQVQGTSQVAVVSVIICVNPQSMIHCQPMCSDQRSPSQWEF